MAKITIKLCFLSLLLVITDLKMRLQAVIWLATLAVVCLGEEQTNEWSWNGNVENTQSQQTYAIESNAPSGSGIDEQSAAATNYNETSVSLDEFIDTLLQSNRQGRALEGYDEVYSDPSVQDAIQKGDDGQARNLIKDKLCTLGLMQCDSEENIEGKRPFLAPGEYIYAQPPNGYRGPQGPQGFQGPPGYQGQQGFQGPQGPPGMRPPLQNTRIIYGPPKPMPTNLGPPRKVGYVSQSRPIYSSLPGPIVSGGPPPDFQGPIYHSKPPGPVYDGGSSPYKFEAFNSHNSHGHEEHHEFGGGLLQPSASKPVIVGAEPQTVNIHHHYHHVDKDTNKGPAVVPVPVPVGNALGSAEFGSHNGLSSSGFDYQSFKQSSSLGGLSSLNGYGSGAYGAGEKPVFEGVSNFDSHSVSNAGPAVFGTHGGQGVQGVQSIQGGHTGLGGSIDSYGQSTGLYSGNVNGGSFHSGNPDYYKKALNGGSNFNSINSQFSNGYGGQYGSNANSASNNNYQSLESSRQDNFDCVCVPFEQCPARDVFGRKGDLILPLDPRNLGKDIEALSDDEKTNSTVPVTRVAKEAKEAEEAKDDKEEENEPKTDANAESETETKKISKRDVSEQKSDNLEKADGQAVSYINKIYIT